MSYGTEDWLRHPHTARLRKEYADQLVHAQADLLQVCERSTDVEVRSALVKVRELEKMLGAFRSAPQKEQEDDE